MHELFPGHTDRENPISTRKPVVRRFGRKRTSRGDGGRRGTRCVLLVVEGDGPPYLFRLAFFFAAFFFAFFFGAAFFFAGFFAAFFFATFFAAGFGAGLAAGAGAG
jgi:hypothetical protein